MTTSESKRKNQSEIVYMYPKISVCIPTYNRAQYIAIALESVLSQSYQDYEIVILDDGSADDTESIVKNIQNTYPDKIRYYKQENSGIPKTRNKLIELARGEYILWQDSDDILCKDVLGVYADFIQKFPDVGVFYGDFQSFGNRQLIWKIEDFYKNSARIISLLINGGGIIVFGSSVIKKEVFKTYGGFNETYERGQDIEFLLRLVSKVEFKAIGTFSILCRYHDDNISAVKVDNQTFWKYEKNNITYVLNNFTLAMLFPQLDWTKEKTAQALAYFEVAKSYARKYGEDEALSYYIEAFKAINTTPIIDTWDKVIGALKKAFSDKDYIKEHLQIINELITNKNCIPQHRVGISNYQDIIIAQDALVDALIKKGWEDKKEQYLPHFKYVALWDVKINPKETIIITVEKYNDQILTILKNGENNSVHVGGNSNRPSSLHTEIILVNYGSDDPRFETLKPHIDTYIKVKENTSNQMSRIIGSAFASAPTIKYIEVDSVVADSRQQTADSETVNRLDAPHLKFPSPRGVSAKQTGCSACESPHTNNPDAPPSHLQPATCHLTPKISVCIPAYNSEKYIATTLESVLSQPFQDFEIVILNDGSTDGTESVALSIQAAYPDKIRYYKQDNAGIPRSNNKLIDLARGEYILWLDNDDLLYKDTLSIYADFIHRYPDVGVFYGYLMFFGQRQGAWKPLNYSLKSNKVAFSTITGHSPIPNTTSIVKKSIYHEYGGYNATFCRASDLEFWARISPNVKFMSIETYAGYYRNHGENLSAIKTSFQQYHLEDVRVITMTLQIYTLPQLFPTLDWKNEKLATVLSYMEIAKNYALRYAEKESLTYYTKAFIELGIQNEIGSFDMVVDCLKNIFNDQPLLKTHISAISELLENKDKIPKEKYPPSTHKEKYFAQDTLKCALKQKGWDYKYKLYNTCFEYVELCDVKPDPKISVIVIAWKYNDLILNNLKLLRTQLPDQAEIVFLNNGSEDTRFDLFKPYIDTFVKLSENTGCPMGRNIATVFAKAPILCFIDDDCIPDENVLSSHLKLHHKYDIFVARGRALPITAGSKTPYCYAPGDKMMPMICDLEGNSSFNAKVFYEFGGFDDNVRYAGEGVDLSYRILKKYPRHSLQIYSPEPLIYHEYVTDPVSDEKRKALIEESKLRCKTKYPDWDWFIENYLLHKNDKIEIKKDSELADSEVADSRQQTADSETVNRLVAPPSPLKPETCNLKPQSPVAPPSPLKPETCSLKPQNPDVSQSPLKPETCNLKPQSPVAPPFHLTPNTYHLPPKISVCIPTYNRQKYIAATLESVLSQPYQDYEIVILDDGSTDDTESIVKSFQATYPDKIRYYWQEKSTVPKTRNKLITLARGEYILWQDSDDILYPNVLSVYADFIQRYPDVGVFYGYFRSFGLRQLTWWVPEYYLKSADIIPLLATGGCFLVFGSSVIKKEVFTVHGGFDETFTRSEDAEFLHRIATKVEFKRIDTFSILCRYHDDNISATKMDNQTFWSFESNIISSALKNYTLPLLFPQLDWKNEKTARANAYLQIAKNYARRYADKESLCYYSKAIKLINPSSEIDSWDNVVHTLEMTLSDQSLLKEHLQTINELLENKNSISQHRFGASNHRENHVVQKSLQNALTQKGWKHKLTSYQSYFECVELWDVKPNPQISIIVLAWQFNDMTLKTLSLLRQQAGTSISAVEIVLLNNGSDDQRFQSYRPYVDTYVKLNANTGCPMGRNIATVFANAPILCFIDDDCIPDENLIASHLKLHTQYDIIVARGRALPITPNSTIPANYDLGPQMKTIFCDLEGNSSYKAKPFFEVDGWDDNVKCAGEGVDLSYRILKKYPKHSLQIYSPEPLIYHDYINENTSVAQKKEKSAQAIARCRAKFSDWDEFMTSWKVHKWDTIAEVADSGQRTADSKVADSGQQTADSEVADSGQQTADSETVNHLDSPQSATSSFPSSLCTMHYALCTTPLLSVCIPAYNSSKYIRETIESVLSQPFQDYEIVVLNDGSTDDTESIVLSLQASHPDKIRYFRQENSGIPRSNNRLIELSRGEYLLWLDNDDILCPDVLSVYAEYIRRFADVSVFYGNLIFFGERQGEWAPIDYYQKPNEMANSLIAGASPIPNTTSVVKKSVYTEFGGYNDTFYRAGDAEFWTRISAKVRFKSIETYAGYYRHHGENTSAINSDYQTYYAEDARIITLTLQIYTLPQLFPQFDWSKEKTAKSLAFLEIARNYANRYALKESLSYYQKAFVEAGFPTMVDTFEKVIETLRLIFGEKKVVNDHVRSINNLLENKDKIPQHKYPPSNHKDLKRTQKNLKDALIQKRWEHKQDLYSKYFEYRELYEIKQNPAISIIVIAWRYNDLTLNNIRLLRSQIPAQTEIVFVNNGCDDSRFDVYKQYIDVYVKLNTNTGAYLSRNFGALFAKAPLLCFIDDDCIPDENLISSHLYIQTHYDVLVVRGRVLPITPGSEVPNCYNLGSEMMVAFCDTEGNSSFKASAFYLVDGWGDDIKIGGGGADIGYKILKKYPLHRYQIYSPLPLIYHDFVRDTMTQEQRQITYKNGQSRSRAKYPDWDDYMKSWKAHVADEIADSRQQTADSKTENHLDSPQSATSHQLPATSLPRPVAPPSHLTPTTYHLTPKISICIATYNHAPYIREAIESALAQDYDHYEIVILNDGSTDNTDDIVKSIQNEKIRYYSKENEGIAPTYNKLLALAKGDYVMWLGSDDLLVPNILGRYVDFVNKYPEVDVFWGSLKLFGQPQFDQKVNPDSFTEDYYHKNARLISDQLVKNPIPNGGALVRKTIYTEFGGFDETFPHNEDYDFWCRISHKALFKHIEARSYLHRRHGNNASWVPKYPKEYFSQQVRIHLKHLANHSLSTLFPDFDWNREKTATILAYLEIAKLFIRKYDEPLSLEYYSKAFTAMGLHAQKLDLQKVMNTLTQIFSNDSLCKAHIKLITTYISADSRQQTADSKVADSRQQTADSKVADSGQQTADSKVADSGQQTADSETVNRLDAPHLKFPSPRGVSAKQTGCLACGKPHLNSPVVSPSHLPPSTYHLSPKIALCIPTPDRTRKQWGDTFFAEKLMEALVKVGHSTEMFYQSEWDNISSQEIVIVIRGRSRYFPRKDKFNILWIISNPDKVTVEELADFQLVFCASKPFTDYLSPLTTTPVKYLPQATQAHYFDIPISAHRGKECDLLFVGINNQHTTNGCRKIVKNVLSLGKDYDFRIYGNHFQHIVDSKYIYGKFIDFSLQPQAYSSAKINLNDHTDAMQKWGFINNRTLDIAALGQFQISDYVPGIEELGIITYTTPDELHTFIDYYLHHEDERNKIAMLNRERVREYTFDNIVKRMLSFVGTPLVASASVATADSEIADSGQRTADSVADSGQQTADSETVNRLDAPPSPLKPETCNLKPESPDAPPSHLTPNTYHLTPKFSVCIPTYNCSKYIQSTLDSVLSQSFSDYEIVILDDGSTDDTESVVKSIQSRHPEKIRYYRQENAGIPATRNRLVDLSRGEWILWLDSDDLLCKGVLDTYAHHITKYTDVGVFYGNVAFFGQRQGDWRLPDFYKKTAERILTQIKGGSVIPNNGTLVKKSVYLQYGSYDETFHRASDAQFWSRIADSVEFKHIGDFTAYYRFYGGNVSVIKRDNKAHRSYEARIITAILKKYPLQMLFPYFDWKAEKTATALAYLEIAKNYASRYADVESISYYSKAFNQIGTPLKNTDFYSVIDSLKLIFGNNSTVKDHVDTINELLKNKNQIPKNGVPPSRHKERKNADKTLEYALKRKGLNNKFPLYCRNFDYIELFDIKQTAKKSIVFIATQYDEKTLRDLKLLHSQNDPHTEIVLVNNGSPDPRFDTYKKFVDTYIKLTTTASHQIAKNIGAVFAVATVEVADSEIADSETVNRLDAPHLIFPSPRGVSAKQTGCSACGEPQPSSPVAPQSSLKPETCNLKPQSLDAPPSPLTPNTYHLTPKISVCIPTYNRAHYLPEAVQSVLAQAYENLEIVIVDDGSTDNTAEVVRSMIDTYGDKIRYFIKENSGIPQTRNRLLAEAKGEYILWLDSDDVLSPNILKVYTDLFDASGQLPYDILYCDIQCFDHQTKNIVNHFRAKDYTHNERYILENLLLDSGITFPGSFMRKSIVETAGGFDEEFACCEDFELWSRLCKVARFHKVDQILYSLRIHDSNTASGNKVYADTSFESLTFKKIVARNSLMDIFPNIDWTQAEAPIQAYFNIAKAFFRFSDFYSCIQTLRKVAYRDFEALYELYIKALIGLSEFWQAKTEAQDLYSLTNQNKYLLYADIATQLDSIDIALKNEQTLNPAQHSLMSTLKKSLGFYPSIFYLYSAMRETDTTIKAKYLFKATITSPIRYSDHQEVI